MFKYIALLLLVTNIAFNETKTDPNDKTKNNKKISQKTQQVLESEIVFEKALKYFEWLEKHMHYFAACTPKKVGNTYVLCDKTKISKNELVKLFKMSPNNLIQSIKDKRIKIEILCDNKDSNNPFKAYCSKTSTRKMFKEITSLHGKYLPSEKTILIRSSAYPGSLIHEYLHFLQAENSNLVLGKIYKKERLSIQKLLTKIMDKNIALVKELEKNKKINQNKIKLRVDEFMIASKLMMSFGNWQDFIDERALFQLYIMFGNEFGASKKDIALAKLNMKHICSNKAIKDILPSTQCKTK